uniref:Uncharacterized protein n=1 Tax=Denticeps clupeoides TaxID=299321 RepID=A0AAY4AWJ8_9TELE
HNKVFPDLSPKQTDILLQFWDKIQDILPKLPAQSDYYLLRCYQLRKMNENLNIDKEISSWIWPALLL